MTGRTLVVLFVILTLFVGGVHGAVDHADEAGGTVDHTTEALAVSNSTNPGESYILEQGDRTIEIEPLQSDETVQELYDYRNHQTHPDDVDRDYSSHGTTELQADDTSILFLYEGPDGLSLVMIHDQLDGNTTGGVTTFDITGLPHDAEWVVQDDLYDSETNMAEWYRDDGYAGASWIWAEARTDGGAIQGGLDDEFALTIHPAFNEEAEHYDNDDLYDPDFFEDGVITDWEILSGHLDDPDRTALDMDEPVTIRTGTADDPSVSYDRTDDGLEATITDPKETDTIELQATSGSTDEVEFHGLELTNVDRDVSVTFENGHPETPSPSPDGVESLSHLTIDAEPEVPDASATVTFTIEESTLEEYDLEPDEIVLYEQHGDDWNESTTTVEGEFNGTYEFSADVTSLSALTVAPTQDSESHDGFSSTHGIGIGVALGTVLGVGWLVVANRRSS